MRLFIQIRDGQPYEHPIFEDNFREAFPHVDVDNLPLEFANFERVDRPGEDTYVRVFKTYRVSYEWVDGMVKDVWTLCPMTDEEKEAALDMRVTSLENRRQIAINYAQSKINIETDVGITVWTNYLNVLNVFTYQRQDAFEVSLPSPPKKDTNGEWVTNASSGSAPNVIG